MSGGDREPGCDTNCIKLLRFLYLAQMSDSLEHGAPLELVEGSPTVSIFSSNSLFL